MSVPLPRFYAGPYLSRLADLLKGSHGSDSLGLVRERLTPSGSVEASVALEILCPGMGRQSAVRKLRRLVNASKLLSKETQAWLEIWGPKSVGDARELRVVGAPLLRDPLAHRLEDEDSWKAEAAYEAGSRTPLEWLHA